jgi:hypothetical protein
VKILRSDTFLSDKWVVLRNKVSLAANRGTN